MQNTFKSHMLRTYSHNEMADMANHGSNSGHRGLIWTKDLVSLYNEHGSALHEIIAEYKDETGELPSFVLEHMDDVDQFQAAVVYFAVELVAHEVTLGEYIEEGAPEAAEYVGEWDMSYKIVEKKNPLAVHVICDTEERAKAWIQEKSPVYCSKGYFIDKTLTPDSFMIVKVQ